MSEQRLRNWLQENFGINPKDLHKYKMAVTMQQYEVLEFFGDSVLGFIVAEYLVTQYEFIDQPGLFTHIKAKLVKNQNLAQIAEKMDLGSLAVIPSTSNREQIGAQMLADMLEALIGATYLDYGLETCQEIIKNLFNLEQTTLKELIVDGQPKARNSRELRKQVEAKVKEENISSVQHKNPVSALQEFLAKRGESPPEYTEVRRIGEPHLPTFTIKASCRFGGRQLSAKGEGKKLKEAKKNAAYKSLSRVLKLYSDS